MNYPIELRKKVVALIQAIGTENPHKSSGIRDAILQFNLSYQSPEMRQYFESYSGAVALIPEDTTMSRMIKKHYERLTGTITHIEIMALDGETETEEFARAVGSLHGYLTEMELYEEEINRAFRLPSP